MTFCEWAGVNVGADGPTSAERVDVDTDLVGRTWPRRTTIVPLERHSSRVPRGP